MESGVPGAAVCVAEDGRLREVRVVGRCCHRGRPIDDATVWPAASLAKQVVAALVLQLARQNAIDLDASMEEHALAAGAAPDPRLAALTARHLLTHHGGFPNWRPPGEPLRLLAAPGERFGYSGEGFELLLGLVDPDAGLASLGMADSAFGRLPSSSVDENVAVGHPGAGREEPYGRVPGFPTRLYLTARDCGMFLARLTARVPEGWVEQLVTPAVWLDDTNARTLGMALRRTPSGDLVGQHGDDPGFKHLLWARLAGGAGVAVFTNSDTGMDLARRVAASVVGEDCL